ncbi:hypothetical protein L1987_16309 [Smallanthus sonchifolius]|uniref:Uncharacterized protein n=1 Tax=Smallanthus sonchifolius TaxID=185202 RepID=A0ACB9J8Z0_9ASTR|nr:hypothetical protein L1987_16309 [Smallanthus sonchifolius]
MEVLKRCGQSIGYNLDVLNRIDDAMAYLVTGNGQYFNEGDFGSVLGVAQCIQDLSLSDCQDCLSEASGRLRSECDTSTWGDMYLGKCYIRYVDQGVDAQAYNSNSGYNNSQNRRGDGENNDIIIKVIGYIAAAVLGGGLTFAVTVSVKNCNRNGIYLTSFLQD